MTGRRLGMTLLVMEEAAVHTSLWYDVHEHLRGL